jgi:ATP-dependent Clp protease ATP-binding subunit ClpC
VLASQYALPQPLFDYRALNGGLLYRARTGRAPPRLHPMVLVLDVSPAAFGPIEAMTRPAAHAVATTLRAAGLPVALVTAGGAGTARLADSAAAALAVLTERSLELADAVRAMAKAETLRRTLTGHGAEPLVLLLSHPWFGAEEPDAMIPTGLRALFIQYPGTPVRPAWADRCARSETLPPNAWSQLPQALGRLIA